MPITEAEREIIEALIDSMNEQVNEILEAREDVLSLLRVHETIDDNATENAILAAAKNRAQTAAQAIVDLL